MLCGNCETLAGIEVNTGHNVFISVKFIKQALFRPRKGSLAQGRLSTSTAVPTVSLAIATTTIKCFGVMIGMQVARSCCQGCPSYQ